MRRSSSSSSDFGGLTDSLGLTKSVLASAINQGKYLLSSRATKLNEGHLLFDAASSLHAAAQAFLSRVDSYDDQRDKSPLEQLSETNNCLESAYTAFTDYMVQHNSSRAGSVKKIVTALMPLVPPLVYAMYEHYSIVPDPPEPEDPGIPDIMFFNDFM